MVQSMICEISRGLLFSVIPRQGSWARNVSSFHFGFFPRLKDSRVSLDPLRPAPDPGLSASPVRDPTDPLDVIPSVTVDGEDPTLRSYPRSGCLYLITRVPT